MALTRKFFGRVVSLVGVSFSYPLCLFLSLVRSRGKKKMFLRLALPKHPDNWNIDASCLLVVLPIQLQVWVLLGVRSFFDLIVLAEIYKTNVKP